MTDQEAIEKIKVIPGSERAADEIQPRSTPFDARHSTWPPALALSVFSATSRSALTFVISSPFCWWASICASSSPATRFVRAAANRHFGGLTPLPGRRPTNKLPASLLGAHPTPGFLPRILKRGEH
jgi:hypothetical protein